MQGSQHKKATSYGLYEPLRIVVVYLQKRGFEKNAIEILACLQLIASFQQIATQKRRIPIVCNHA